MTLRVTKVDRMPKRSEVSKALDAPVPPLVAPDRQKQLMDNYSRNSLWANPGTSYQTPLTPQAEQRFQEWVKRNNIPFDPRERRQDYDMRGYWAGLLKGDPVARQAYNPSDKKMHFPDKWKTPYHSTFSNESQYATPNAPHWTKDNKLVTQDGQVLYDEGGTKE